MNPRFFSPLPLSTHATQETDHFLTEFSPGKLRDMENTEFPRICRFVKLLVNEGFLAVKTGCELRESNSIIRKLISKCKHMYGNIFHASCWCQSQTNPHFKRLYARPKSNFSQFWRYLLTEPLSDCLVLFLKSRVDNLEDIKYFHKCSVFAQWLQAVKIKILWIPFLVTVKPKGKGI